MTFTMIMSVIVLHWVADFVFQTRWQMRNKASCIYALSAHVGMYTAAIGVYAFAILAPILALKWTLINGILHFITDVLVSRCTKYFWNKRQYQNFILMIGVDQIVHYACLFGTLVLFLNLPL